MKSFINQIDTSELESDNTPLINYMKLSEISIIKNNSVTGCEIFECIACSFIIFLTCCKP